MISKNKLNNNSLVKVNSYCKVKSNFSDTSFL